MTIMMMMMMMMSMGKKSVIRRLSSLDDEHDDCCCVVDDCDVVSRVVNAVYCLSHTNSLSLVRASCGSRRGFVANNGNVVLIPCLI